jgi:hypothetical protein
VQGQLSSQDYLTASLSGSLQDEWREEFNNAQDTGDWQFQGTGNYTYSVDGNAAGASYLKLTLDPTDPTASLTVYGGPSKKVHTPYRVGFGLSVSRRSPFQLTWFGLVGSTRDSVPEWPLARATTLGVSAGVTVTSNVASISTSTPHGLVIGDRVVTSGFAEQRVNANLVVASIPSATTFTAALTLANATYGTTGTVTKIDSGLGSYANQLVQLVDATPGNAAIINGNSGATSNIVQAWNPGSTWDTSVIPNYYANYSSPYVYSHQPRNIIELENEREWMGWYSAPVDSTSAIASTITRDQVIPLFNKAGALPVISVINTPNAPTPLPITVAAKSGTTTATLTIPNHGLTISDVIYVVGIRDQANFPSAASSYQIASVVNANQITVVFGGAVTATSYGGFVVKASNNTQALFTSSAVQSTSVTSSGRLSLQFGASVGTPVVGESVYLFGIVDSTNTRQASIEGLWRVASWNTTTFVLELDPMKGQIPAAFTTVGGTIMLAPDIRIHSIRAHSHARLGVDIENSRGSGRIQNSVPVTFGGNPGVSVAGTPSFNIAQIVSATAGSAIDNAGTNRALEVIQAGSVNMTDRAAAAITTSGNSGVISQALGAAGLGAAITVTATSGTSPTLDLTLEESYDNGTTFQKVYDFPRITANGVYQLPAIALTGRRRWSWVVGGTTPSFTVAINVFGAVIAKTVKQVVDRSINPNTLNSVTPSINITGCSILTMQVSSGAGATVNPTYNFQLSHDNTNWFTPGGGASVAPSTNQFAASANYVASWARIIITSAGTGATQNFVVLNASEV